MIEQYIKLGEINTLKVNRDTPHGVFLEALDEETVLLPKRYVPNDLKVDDTIDVFVYTDSEDRLVATTEEPYGKKNQFIFSKVVDTTSFGAFVDWGLQKDLFVPKNKQKKIFRVGDSRIVRIVEDDKSGRLIGVEKITSFLKSNTKSLKPNQEVSLLVFAKTDLGYKAIINHTYEGVIYKNEIFHNISVGDSLQGWIKNIRQDGKVDLSLQPIGKNLNKSINSEKILTILKQNDGELPYNYKTDPQTIQDVFGISKKNYKRALTTLLEDNLITIDTHIKLKEVC